MCRNPLHCLIPPFMLEHLAQTAEDPDERAWAITQLQRDDSIRLARVQNARRRGGGTREGADAIAALTEARPDRMIEHGNNSEELADATVVRRESDGATGDAAVDEAFDFFGDTFRFWYDVYGRNSIDDAGMPLRGVVHYGDRVPNAYWDGKRMLFGDGDGTRFGRMTQSLDVIGHELGHGVIEEEAGLGYYGEPGALNESIADVCGSLVKQHKNGQTADQADWLIGAEVWSPEIQGDALRSMSDPGGAYDDPRLGKDPQPKHMRDFKTTVRDHGGVHINSGIPNHAFYLVAKAFKGRSWEGAGLIWYETLQHPALGPDAGFARFASLTLRVAERLYGARTPQFSAVYDAWQAVGVMTDRPG